jgi:PAS domain S-box-containing protein
MLQSVLSEQMQWMDEVVKTNDNSFNEARLMIASGVGKKRTDSVRSLVSEIQEYQRTEFSKSNRVTRKSLQQFQYSFMGLALSAIAMVICLFYIINRILGARKKAQQELHLAVEETKILYNEAPCGYLSVDSSIYISNINNTLLNWLGYNREEVIGKMKYEDLLTHESRKKFLHSFQEDFEAYKTKGYVSDLEFDFLRKDGTAFPVVVNSSAVFTEAGEFEKSRTTVFDNTARKKAQEQIAYLARLVEDSHEAVYSVTTNFHIRSWNKGAESLYGFTAEEAIGKQVFEIIRSRMPEEDLMSIRKQILKDGHWEGEQKDIRKDNTTIYVLASATATRNNAGKIEGYVSVCRDITDRKNAEESLNKLNAELETFTYSVSHDLRAPLRSIAGYSQILKEDYSEKLDAEGQRITDVIIKNAYRMGMLIDDLLDFTRLGRKEMMKRKVNMPEVVEDVLTQLTGNENGRKISIKNLVQLSTEADPAMIQHVWTNLISNALKYSSKKEITQIEIGAYEEIDSICYYVQDNGAGFDMLYVNKLFGVFQRLHKMNEFEGTGVGLALVKAIVSRHGGKVWAEGKLNEGATFYFTLPRGQAEKSATA